LYIVFVNVIGTIIEKLASNDAAKDLTAFASALAAIGYAIAGGFHPILFVPIRWAVMGIIAFMLAFYAFAVGFAIVSGIIQWLRS
jgi:hypothetical protein